MSSHADSKTAATQGTGAEPMDVDQVITQTLCSTDLHGSQEPAQSGVDSQGGEKKDLASAFEKEERFYGKNPVHLVEDMFNAVEDYLGDGLDSLEKALTQTPALKNSRAAVAAGVDKLYQHLQDKMDVNQTKLWNYLLTKILPIPADLCLPDQTADDETEGKLVASASLDTSSLDKDISELQNRLQAGSVLKSVFEAELGALDQELSRISDQTDTLQFCSVLGPDGGRVVPVVQLGRQLLEEAKQLTEYEVTAGDDTPAVFGAPMDTDDKQYRHAQEHVPVTAEGLNMASSMLQ